MSFLTASESQELISDSYNSKSLKSGLHNAIIRYAIIRKSKNNAEMLTLVVEIEKVLHFLFDVACIKTKEGKQNETGVKLVNKMMWVTGIKEIKNTESIPMPKEVKDVMEKTSFNEEVMMDVLPEFTDSEIILSIVKEFRKYNDKIQTNYRVLNVFRISDYASAQEIVNKVPIYTQNTNENDSYIGKQFKIEFAQNKTDVYKDELTEEIVKEYFRSKTKKTPKQETENKKTFDTSSHLFGNK